MQPVSNQYMSPVAQNIAEEEQRYEEISKEVDELWKKIGPERCYDWFHNNQCKIYYGNLHIDYKLSSEAKLQINLVNLKLQDALNRKALCEHRIILMKHQLSSQKLGV